jgi:hypothetical protein
MIDWGTIASLAIAIIITVILWYLAHRARRHPIDEGL